MPCQDCDKVIKLKENNKKMKKKIKELEKLLLTNKYTLGGKKI
tara:strand:+ start:337 stop:465 length:129 start_codon:yes stop_codon:yes gene_type:complete